MVLLHLLAMEIATESTGKVEVITFGSKMVQRD